MSSTQGPGTFFANVVARPRGARPTNADTFRRYMAPITTRTTLQGCEEADVKRVFYEVGRHEATRARALAAYDPTVATIVTRFPTSSVVSDTVSGLARKYSNFAGRFEFCSLASVVQRLASGLAAWTLYGGVTSADLRGGDAFAIYGLGTLSAPVSSHDNYVFIPRLVDDVVAPNVLSILASAVIGCGGTVITDVLSVDLVDRTPFVSEVDNVSFPRACVDALRVLGSNFAAANAGDQFAVAFTTGLHNTLTVVGHTDEGGVIRDMFRRAQYSPPFGCIHCGLADYMGIPGLVSNNVASVSGYVDAIALATAGLVAHCDPGMVFDGEWVPTLLVGTGFDDDVQEPGANTPGTPAMADANRGQLIEGFSKFARLYVIGLSKMFGFVVAESDAVSWLAAKVSLLDNNNRHLRYPSVSPYFWIEPTSLIPHDFLGSPVELNGFGSRATVSVKRELPAFENVHSVRLAEQMFSEHLIKFRTARACNFLYHFGGHMRNGLGAVVPLQLDVARVAQPGPDAIPLVRDRLVQGAPFSSYLWARGQSPFPAPGEFYNLAFTMGIRFRHLQVDYNTGGYQSEHLPSPHEVASLLIGFDVGVPTGLNNGASNSASSDARRARTRASDELASVSLRTRHFGSAVHMGMAVSFSVPSLGSFTNPNVAGFGGGGLGQAQSGLVGAPPPNGGGTAPTVPLIPVGHHQPLRAPQITRAPAPPGGGSGGAPPPGGSGGPPPAPPGGPTGNDPPPPPPNDGSAEGNDGGAPI